MKERWITVLLTLVLVLSVLPGCQNHIAVNETRDVEQSLREQSNDSSPEALQEPNTSAPVIRPLTINRQPRTLQAVDGVDPYEAYWCEIGMDGFVPSAVAADLSDAAGVAYSIAIGDKTTFIKALPDGYDPQELIEWGKYPGLNVDILHRHGFTGKGAVIAYVDQPVVPHEQYDRANIHVINNAVRQDNSMHGPAVLSLLAGKDIGVAPDADVYYYGFEADTDAQAHEADCLYQIIERNKTLPEGETIRMVGFSDNIDESEAHVEEFREAVKACEDAGIMVWFCGENGAMFFLPGADRNAPDNLVSVPWAKRDPSLVWVPSGGRTTAATMAQTDYIYWGGDGGLSWTMPYTMGLYAIAIEIDPTLTQDALRGMIVDTAYVNGVGQKIVNPVGFVAAALRGVGRGEEAQAMLDEVKARTRYLYAVMNTTAMTPADFTTVNDYLAAVTDATVLIVDTTDLSDVQGIREAVRQDAGQRGGSVASVCIIDGEDVVAGLPTTALNGTSGLCYAVLNGYEKIVPNEAAAAICESKGSIRWMS